MPVTVGLIASLSGAAPGALLHVQRKQRRGLHVFSRFGETGGGDRTGDEGQPDRGEPGLAAIWGRHSRPRSLSYSRPK